MLKETNAPPRKPQESLHKNVQRLPFKEDLSSSDSSPGSQNISRTTKIFNPVIRTGLSEIAVNLILNFSTVDTFFCQSTDLPQVNVCLPLPRPPVAELQAAAGFNLIFQLLPTHPPRPHSPTSPSSPPEASLTHRPSTFAQCRLPTRPLLTVQRVNMRRCPLLNISCNELLPRCCC